MRTLGRRPQNRTANPSTFDAGSRVSRVTVPLLHALLRPGKKGGRSQNHARIGVPPSGSGAAPPQGMPTAEYRLRHGSRLLK